MSHLGPAAWPGHFFPHHDHEEIATMASEHRDPATTADASMCLPVEPKGGGGTFFLCPAGTFPAVLIGIIDIGTHLKTFLDGRQAETREVDLVFELDELRPDGTRHLIGVQASMTLREGSKLRELIENLLSAALDNGPSFDVADLLGRACLVGVAQLESRKGNAYHKITTVTSLPRGMPAPQPQNELVFYHTSMGPPPPILETFPHVFEGGQLKPLLAVIESSVERQGQRARAAGTNGNTNVNGPAPRPQPQPEPEPAPEPRPARAASQSKAVRATPKPTPAPAPEPAVDTVQRASAAAAQASRHDQADLIRQAQERFKNSAATVAAPAIKADRFPFQEDDDPVVAGRG
jgi:outer membrane biosynthesis protein TonB